MIKKSHKILLVEDELAITDTIKEYLALEKDCFEFKSCSNGLIAIKMIDEYTPDVIVVDLILPELDGFGFLIKLEQLFQDYMPIIIAISSIKDTDIIKKTKELGADYFLAKPFKLQELKSIIKSQIKKKRKTHINS